MPESPATLSCARCGAGISNDDLAGGLAVRVDGELVCQMCVDSLPGEAVVRINQVRAMRGLEVTTYSVKHEKCPRLQLFSFTTSANISNHRRKLASDGFFDAPPLPPPAERQALPSASSSKVATDRVARGQMPARGPMLIAAGATVVVLAGIAIAIAAATPPNKTEIVQQVPSEMPVPAPTKAMKTRLDYPVDALQAWSQANQDRDCPALIRQSIAQELIRKRGTQLDDAEKALKERRFDEATSLTNLMILPDDIAFRDLRRRENDLRAELRDARIVASVPTPVPSVPTAVETKPESIAQPPTPGPPAVKPDVVASPNGALRLLAEKALLEGKQLKLVNESGVTAVGYWFNSAEFVRWTVHLDQPGNFRVDVRTAAKGDGNLMVQVGEQRVANVLPSTGSWNKYRQTTLGVITINTAADIEVRAGAFNTKTWQPLNLAEIILSPTSDPSSPPPTPLTPKPVDPPPAPEKPSKPAVALTAWNYAFVTGDRAPKAVALDGSEHVPAGLPGGVDKVFRSLRSTGLKRHAAFLDLANASATDGGVVVLVHPGRNDRNEILASLTDSKGTTVKFEVVELPDDAWTPIVLPMSAAEGLDGNQLVTLALEDTAKGAHIPDDSGFLIGKTVVISGRSPRPGDLHLRASPLLPDQNRLRNLPKLFDLLAKSRKKSNFLKFIEPSRLRILSGSWGKDQKWRNEMRKQLGMEAAGKNPPPVFIDCPYNEKSLAALTATKGPLDPTTVHIVVIWTGGEELDSFADVKTAMSNFWKPRIEQFIDAGILPIVVIGPNFQTGEKRALAEELWQQLITLTPIRLYALPVFDLRALPTAENGSWDEKTEKLTGQLLDDGIKEINFTLRRLGAPK